MSESDTMQATRVGIREFRAGLAEFIAAEKPVAVTRHGVTVGIFIPTHGPSQADLLALKRATAQLEALMPLSDRETEAIAAEVKVVRGRAAAGRRGR